MFSLLSHLAIVSNAPVSMIVQIALPYLTFNSSRYIPGLELLDRMLILVSNIFEESLYCFPQLYNFTFSQTVQKCLISSYTLQRLWNRFFLIPFFYLEIFIRFCLILLHLKCLLLASMTPHNINCLIYIIYLCLFCSWSLNVSIPLTPNYNS